MKTAIYCLVFTMLSSSALAQELVDFELDNYKTSNFGRNPPPAYAPNDNITTEYRTVRDDRGSYQEPTGCYYIPGRFNMSAGDTVLSADPTSIIYTLLTSLGQTESHSGMALSATAIRHNTADPNTIDQTDTPRHLKATGSRSLRDAGPGVMTQQVEAAVNFDEFNLKDGLVLYSEPKTGFADAAVKTALRAAQHTTAVAQMTQLQGYYRFYSYTDMTWKKPLAKTADDGEMCAGTIFYANMRAGNTNWTPSAWVSYTADVRNSAASVLYRSVHNYVRDAPDWWQDAALFALNAPFKDLGLPSGESLGDIETHTANQVVNCMAFDDCNNTTDRWKKGVGTGLTMSPNDVYNYAFLNLYVSNLTGTDNGFIYNAVRPVQATGNYYCCQTPADSRGARTTTCSFK